MGSSKRSLLKKMQGTVDLRRRTDNATPADPRRPAIQARLVEMFFLELYHQTAEDLPDTYHTVVVDATMSYDAGFDVYGDTALYAK